jgi:hypothetical protein
MSGLLNPLPLEEGQGEGNSEWVALTSILSHRERKQKRSYNI